MSMMWEDEDDAIDFNNRFSATVEDLEADRNEGDRLQEEYMQACLDACILTLPIEDPRK